MALGYVQRNKDFARQLRGRMTEAEQRLWFHLRRDQLGVRFYRQKPLGPYIVDFHAPKAKLVIELDGSQHYDDPTQKEKDSSRDAWLSAQGLKVLRFDDRQALTETQAVLEVIFQVVRQSTGGEIPPSPPFAKGGANLATLIGGPLPDAKRGANPPPSIEGSLPGANGGANPLPSIEGSLPGANGGANPLPSIGGSPPLQKGGQGGFSNVSVSDDRQA